MPFVLLFLDLSLAVLGFMNQREKQRRRNSK